MIDDTPDDLPVIGPSEDGLPSDLPLRRQRPTAGQCMKRFAREVGSGWTWAVALIALSGAVTAVAVTYLTARGSYAYQQQYLAASSLAHQLESDGLTACINSFEDGDKPDGCVVIGKLDRSQLKLTLDSDGEVTQVSYQVYIGDLDKVDAAAAQMTLSTMATTAARSQASVCLPAEQLVVDAAHMSKGLKAQRVDSSRVKVGKVTYERIYRYENWKTYGSLVVDVKKPPETVDGSKTKVKKKATKSEKRKKLGVWVPKEGQMKAKLQRDAPSSAL